jgi:hypothetical protein
MALEYPTLSQYHFTLSQYHFTLSQYHFALSKYRSPKFRNDLQRWTRHSEDGRLMWQDRANIGFFKQRRIKTMSEQLQNCKVTINSIVGIATL